MTPWKGDRKDSWASNPNLAVYIFAVLFTVWMGFQIWARIPGGPPAPDELGPMVMTALGVAITVKSHERKEREGSMRKDVDELKRVATEQHPEAAGELGGRDD